MRELETLIQAIEHERNNATECRALKNDTDYQAYLLGKEEAFNLALKLIYTYKGMINNENSNKA